MVTRNELEAALVNAPLDDAGYLVYADWLQAHGEPRGDLIAIDDALHRAIPEDVAAWRRRRDELVARHPELVPSTPPHVRLEWHLGFVCRVRIHDTSQLELLGPLFAHPSLAFVTAVGLESWRFVTTDEIARVLSFVPTTLRALALGDPDRPRRTTGPPLDLTSVVAALPLLEQLFVARAAWFQYGSPTLRELEILDGSAETLASLATVAFPALETLALDLGSVTSLFGMPATGLTAPSLTGVTAMLAAAWPRLTTLALHDAPFGDDLIAALIQSPLLPRLRVLRAWNAGLSIAGAGQITREHFGHLELLDLSDAGLDEEAARLVGDVCRDVRTIPRSARLG